MHGFTESDIQLQSGIVDSFMKHQQPEFLSELQSVQLFGDTESAQRTSADDLADKSSAVKSQSAQLHSLSKKCILKSSFEKHQRRSSLSRLQHVHKHQTPKSSGKSGFMSLSDMIKLLIL